MISFTFKQYGFCVCVCVFCRKTLSGFYFHTIIYNFILNYFNTGNVKSLRYEQGRNS